MAGKLVTDFIQTETGTISVQNNTGGTIFSANTNGMYTSTGSQVITASGNITGNVIGNLTGTVTGNVTGNVVANTITTNSLTSNTSLLTSGTAQNTTSGTYIDFTGIPSWAKRITVMLNGVSTSGTSSVQIRLGTSGGIAATGYAGAFLVINNTATAYSGALSTGIPMDGTGAATTIRSGAIVFNNLSGDTWVFSGGYARTDVVMISSVAGNVTLSGTLDRVRLTTVNGTDTFDAGSVNILWE